ncbi:tetratricopeptide repeat protein [Methyloterricola oryzae]|uniref:tetratricopeptide repeat protein n=1 Tax=Methyloterricola oryzae TaxID=1495050 RepID=UPI0005EAF7E0|nr:tetratricopeptide repeat protein [Methyloterricola oryzae]
MSGDKASNNTVHDVWQSIAYLSCLLCLSAITYLIYSAAFGASFSFDDRPNLSPLRKIVDLQTFLSYIFSGTAGPLGRPIALASFALQFSAWPYAPEEFFYTNVLIHLINGLLVFWVGIHIALNSGELQRHTFKFALTLTAIWMLQPILASASLMVVQRMVTLSTTFMLVGLIGYLSGRQCLLRSERLGWPIMLVSLALGTGLAVFTKETGALLPVYVWILEYTLLPDPKTRVTFSNWRKLLWLAPASLVTFACWHIPGLLEQTQRGFSPLQRLLSQGTILWQYLKLILLPKASEFGPYHDDYTIPYAGLETLMALAIWIAIIALAVQLRKRFPWFAFAALWYILGHALESSIFNLELYFEHRNYLPCLGPIAWLSASVSIVPTVYRRWTDALLAGYVLLLAIVLYEVTSTWGNPWVSAVLWAKSHPNSERAQQNLAQQYVMRSMDDKAFQIIKAASENNPSNAGLALQVIQMACDAKRDVSYNVYHIAPLLETASASYSAIAAIEKLANLQFEGGCIGLSQPQLHRLIDILLANPNFRQIPLQVFNLHHDHARLYLQEGKLDSAVEHLQQAMTARPDLETAMVLLELLIRSDKQKEAESLVKSYRSLAPNNPITRRVWINRLDSLSRQSDY